MAVYYSGVDTIHVTIPAPVDGDFPEAMIIQLSRDGSLETIEEEYIPTYEEVGGVRVYDDIEFDWPVTGNFGGECFFVATGLNDESDITAFSEEFTIQRKITVTGIKVMPFVIELTETDADNKTVTVFRNSTGQGEIAVIESQNATSIVPILETPLGYGTHEIKITLADGSYAIYKYYLQGQITAARITTGTRVGVSIRA